MYASLQNKTIFQYCATNYAKNLSKKHQHFYDAKKSLKSASKIGFKFVQVGENP